MQYLAFVVVLLFGTLASGKLTEFFNFQHEVRGVYKNEDGSLGIKFTSREGALHIRNLDDVTLTYFNSVREINKRMARSIYVLDSEYLQHQDDSDRHLDGPKDDDTKSFNDAMQELFQMEEVYLLDDAAHAVGERVTGVDTPAALPFFLFALRITQTILSESQVYNDTTADEIPKNSLAHQKRGLFDRIFIQPFRLSCYKYLRNSWCKGLCGPLCFCWRFVCGNCCYNQGCYEHDDCCERKGYLDNRCFFPTGFSCSSFSC